PRRGAPHGADARCRPVHGPGTARRLPGMAVTGALWLSIGRLHDGGPHQPYDAMLHALFLGFVISMIFAHAPVVVPAVLGRPLPYRRVLYLPLVLLHGSLLLRLLGGVAGQ